MSFAASLARPLGARSLRSTRSDSPTRHRSHRRAARIRAAEAEPAPTETKGRFRRRDPDAAPKPAPLGSGPDANAPPSGIKVIPVEQRSRDAFQGVAKVDGEAEDPALRSAKLAAGDALAILAFAAIGRGNHGEGMFFGDVLGTALPFLIGWFATAPLTGTFGEDARVSARRRRSFAHLIAPHSSCPHSLAPSRVSSASLTSDTPFPSRYDRSQSTKTSNAAFAAAKGVIAGVPAGLVLRSIGKGAVPPVPFAIVAMVANGVLLVGWRTWFAGRGAGGGGAGGNKKGNPLEFMSLLMSLTKRW